MESLYVPLSKSDERAHRIITGGPPAPVLLCSVNMHIVINVMIMKLFSDMPDESPDRYINDLMLVLRCIYYIVNNRRSLISSASRKLCCQMPGAKVLCNSKIVFHIFIPILNKKKSIDCSVCILLEQRID